VKLTRRSLINVCAAAAATLGLRGVPALAGRASAGARLAPPSPERPTAASPRQGIVLGKDPTPATMQANGPMRPCCRKSA
jgi:hypothetical protein